MSLNKIIFEKILKNIVQSISSQLQKKKQRRQTEEYWSNPLLVVSRVNADH